MVGEELSKKEIEIILDRLKGKERPDPRLEQHRTPGWIAADMVWIAKQMNMIEGATVLDLGSGVGILCIAAILAGASKCLSLELDAESLKVQQENLADLEVEERAELIRADVASLPVRGMACDLAVLNPPFGTVRKGADVIFLNSAAYACRYVLSLHLSSERSREYISREMARIGRKAAVLKTYKMELKQIFEYHRSRIRRIDVDLYLVE